MGFIMYFPIFLCFFSVFLVLIYLKSFVINLIINKLIL